MVLARLALTATRVGIIEATYNDAGWAISFRDKSGGQLACTNRAGAIRHWRNVDTLIRQLRKAGYRGRLMIPVDAQQQLIGSNGCSTKAVANFRQAVTKQSVVHWLSTSGQETAVIHKQSQQG